MNNLKEINGNILKDWFEFREDRLSSLTCEEDKKHFIYFEEISKRILDSIPVQNRNFVQKHLEQLDCNFYDYNDYWNEKYYIMGFEDAIKLLSIILDMK